MKIGQRMYHEIFGWCKVVTPTNQENSLLVDLEADELEYYVMGKGTIKARRDEDGSHILYTHVSELFDSEEMVPVSAHFKKLAMGVKLTFWNS